MWGVTRLDPGEQPIRGARRLPVQAQHRQQPRRKHDIAILFPFAPAHVNDHAAAVDVVDPQMGDFRDPQPGATSGHQNGSVSDVLDGCQQLGNLLGAEDHGQPLRPLNRCT